MPGGCVQSTSVSGYRFLRFWGLRLGVLYSCGGTSALKRAFLGGFGYGVLGVGCGFGFSTVLLAVLWADGGARIDGISSRERQMRFPFSLSLRVCMCVCVCVCTCACMLLLVRA